MSGSRSTAVAVSAGALLGVLVFGLVRLAAMPPLEDVHYHANWALWVDGERVDLSADRYMEDVEACMADASTMPARSRVHMHENNPDVVHVHHEGATWGHLLQNLGWAVGEDWLVTDAREMHREEEGRRLTFVLNGLVVPPAHGRVIGPGDRLLISMGDEDVETVTKRFESVASDAPEFDDGWDPGGCAGAEPESFGDRLRRAFWF